MRVGVHRHPDLRVPQHIHDHPWRDALNQEQRCAGVAEVVEASLLEASPIQVRMEVPRDGRAFEAAAMEIGEDKVVRMDGRSSR